MKRVAHLLLAICLLAIVPSLVRAQSETIRIVTKNGDSFEGRVFDLGDASLEITQRLGRTTILKRDVLRWGFRDAEGESVPQTVLVLENGREVSGDLRHLDDQKQWEVHLEAGTAHYSDSEVLRVIQPTGVCSDGTFTPRRDIRLRIEKGIAEVRSDDKTIQQDGKLILTSCGFFALNAVETAAAKSDPGKRLADIALRERFRMAIPADIEKAQPGFFKTLTTADARTRVKILEEAYRERGEELYPLLGVLILDASQPAEVRAVAVDRLQRMQCTRELVDAYQAASGQAQLAVAVALGDGGIYIGIPTLIEALSMESPDVRKLAGSRLREYTGEDFGYDPTGDESSQRTAIARYQGWWKQHESDIKQILACRLDPSLENPIRAQAIDLWKRGNDLWQKKDIDGAEGLFRTAVAKDPTYLPPFVCLGIIAYRERGHYPEAQAWLQKALHRARPEGDDDMLRLIHYHLGRIHEAAYDFDQARDSYLSAIEIDQNFIDAWYSLGAVTYHQAILDSKKAPDERRDLFQRAESAFENGYKRLVDYRNGLVVLTRSNLPVTGELPFSPRDYNRGLYTLREDLRRREGDFCYRLAQVWLALGDNVKALEYAQSAAEAPGAGADHHILLAGILTQLGKKDEAAAELKKARAIDPDHPALKKP